MNIKFKNIKFSAAPSVVPPPLSPNNQPTCCRSVKLVTWKKTQMKSSNSDLRGRRSPRRPKIICTAQQTITNEPLIGGPPPRSAPNGESSTGHSPWKETKKGDADCPKPYLSVYEATRQMPGSDLAQFATPAGARASRTGRTCRK